jgi:hypothetical protein
VEEEIGRVEVIVSRGQCQQRGLHCGGMLGPTADDANVFVPAILQILQTNVGPGACVGKKFQGTLKKDGGSAVAVSIVLWTSYPTTRDRRDGACLALNRTQRRPESIGAKVVQMPLRQSNQFHRGRKRKYQRRNHAQPRADNPNCSPPFR